MDIFEAERLFKYYDGHSFHMGREEPEKYCAFMKLDIPNEQKEQWRQEMIREALDKLGCSERLPDMWWIHSRLVDIFNESGTLKKENIEKIATVMKSFTELDLKQKVLILENTAGRHSKDGILMTAYQYGVIAQLGEAIDLIIDSCYSDKDIDGEFWERFCDVKNNYRTKYEKLLKEKGNLK